MVARSVGGISPRFVVFLLCGFLLPGASLCAQQPPSVTPKILVLEGEGAVNSIRQGATQELLVQVTDQDNRPLAGATVTFVLPASGPGATFIDGSRMVTMITDDRGQARVVGMRPNSLAGKFEIRITVAWQGQMARAGVTQTNALEVPAAKPAGAAQPAATKKKGGSGKVIAILVAAAGGGVGAAMAAKGGNKGGGPPPPPPPPTLTIIGLGSSTVGRP